jgi:hypothetical protein
MIECVLTIDYEIYGNGEGSLRDLIYEPAERLLTILDRWDAKLVAFVEAAELQIIEQAGTDPASALVRDQVRRFRKTGHEVALHLHPQWYNARRHNERWALDYREYNLCTLRAERISWMVREALGYLRDVVGEPDFTPLSFRAGNWLFQPTRTAATVLVEQGIRLDSSVFKGGRLRDHRLDYRPARANGYWWRFEDDVNVRHEQGALLEIPTYTVMVPFWKMATGKRLGLQRKGPSTAQTPRQKLNKLLDRLRPFYPLKFDFCRMTMEEFRAILEPVIAEDRATPGIYRPLVAIGHTKDLVDFEVIERLLAYLKAEGIAVTTLEGAYGKCLRAGKPAVQSPKLETIAK